MNRKICENCNRFVADENTNDKWWCAKEVWLESSQVIPGHSYYVREKLHPMGGNLQAPPPWCVYEVEQVVSEKGDDVDMTDNHQKNLVYDGNTSYECSIRGLVKRYRARP
jgi:hypothetical protein